LALRLVVGVFLVEADAFEADEDRAALDLLGAGQEGVQLGQILGRHGHDARRDLGVMVELRELVSHLGDLAAHLRDAVGVLLGEVPELAPEGRGVVHGAVDDGLGLGANVAEAGRDSLRPDQQRCSTECQGTDQAPSEDATCENHGLHPFVSGRAAVWCQRRSGDPGSDSEAAAAPFRQGRVFALARLWGRGGPQKALFGPSGGDRRP
jgi:hypothetical protein